MSTPQHLLPESCYVCGKGKHDDNDDHNYWSNADAARYFRSEWMAADLTYSPEAAYVEEHRPY